VILNQNEKKTLDIEMIVTPQIEQNILACLPYGKQFLFVDHIIEVSENHIIGTFQFPETAYYYQGHFTKKAVTPGVLLLEAMGQIGLVCFGVYLFEIYKTGNNFIPVLSHLEADFLNMVLPGETIKVISEKEYFRNNILKCRIKTINSANETIVTSRGICTFKLDII